MERKVEFNSCGDTIVGVLHIPDGASGPVPCVILAGGWCYVKEIVMPYYAQAFLKTSVAPRTDDCLGLASGMSSFLAVSIASALIMLGLLFLSGCALSVPVSS